MQKTVNRGLLRFAAGRAITCPACGIVLDFRRTVVATAPSGKPTVIACGDCWDAAVDANGGADAVAEWDVIDGRNI